jgi:hypothetical protein
MSALGHKRTYSPSKSCPKSEGSRCHASVGRNVLVFDRSYVTFQALLHSCHLALWLVWLRLACVSRDIWLPMLTAKQLRKILSYAPTTGIFRWEVSASGRAPVGAIAGAKNGRGYHQIRIGGRPYSASRLAWLYMTGKWPNSEVSYINGKPSDTRWANFREVISSQNRGRPRGK